MLDQSDEKELNQFIGRIDQWKEAMTKWSEGISAKLEQFVTMEQFKKQQDEIEALKKRVATIRWSVIVLTVLIAGGELAVHRLDWLLALIK